MKILAAVLVAGSLVAQSASADSPGHKCPPGISRHDYCEHHTRDTTGHGGGGDVWRLSFTRG